MPSGVGADPAHRLGGRRLRQGLRRPAQGLVPTGDGWPRRTHARRATRSTPTDPSPPPTTPRAPTSPSPTRSGPATQTFEPYWYLGFRYLQIDDPGETIGAGRSPSWLVTPPCPTGRPPHSSRPSRTLDAVWNLCAHSALYTSQEQFIDTPTREKGQFLWDAANESQVGHAHPRRPEPVLAGPPRHGEGTGALLALRPDQRGLPQRRRSTGLPDVHRPLPRVGVALLPLDDRRGDHRGAPPDPLEVVGLPDVAPWTPRPVSSPVSPSRPTGTTSTGTTTRRPPTRR